MAGTRKRPEATPEVLGDVAIPGDVAEAMVAGMPPGKSAGMLTLVSDTINDLKSSEREADGAIAAALAALAVRIDAGEARLDEIARDLGEIAGSVATIGEHVQMLVAANEARVAALEQLEADTVAAGGVLVNLETTDLGDLEERVREIESRLSAAGRRLIWSTAPSNLGRSPHPSRWAPDIGRILLFDPETPNPEPDEGVEGHKVHVGEALPPGETRTRVDKLEGVEIELEIKPRPGNGTLGLEPKDTGDGT